MDKRTVQQQVTEEDLTVAMQDAEFSAWPRDGAELIALFNHLIATMAARADRTGEHRC